MKEKELLDLFIDMKHCELCTNIYKKNKLDCSLINIYQQDSFYKEIPSIWTDWFNRLDSNIMIIGQDWGPYNEMVKFHKLYKLNKTKENFKKIVEEEKSLTKKMLTKYLVESALEKGIKIDDKILDKIYITNAIMCARKGDNYRGDNINVKVSTLNCSKYLEGQINILKPKIILTLGYYPLLSLAKIYRIDIKDKLKEVIEEDGLYRINDMVIIPLYHPAAQISKEKQFKQYLKIWDFYGNIGLDGDYDG